MIQLFMQWSSHHVCTHLAKLGEFKEWMTGLMCDYAMIGKTVGEDYDFVTE
jgi:hypothetical protein